MGNNRQRTCVVCRQSGSKDKLWRFGLADVTKGFDSGNIVLDFRQKLSGRSAYCHQDLKCFSSAKLLPQLVSSLSRRQLAVRVKKGQGGISELLVSTREFLENSPVYGKKLCLTKLQEQLEQIQQFVSGS